MSIDKFPRAELSKKHQLCLALSLLLTSVLAGCSPIEGSAGPDKVDAAENPAASSQVEALPSDEAALEAPSLAVTPVESKEDKIELTIELMLKLLKHNEFEAPFYEIILSKDVNVASPYFFEELIKNVIVQGQNDLLSGPIYVGVPDAPRGTANPKKFVVIKKGQENELEGYFNAYAGDVLFVTSSEAALREFCEQNDIDFEWWGGGF